MEAARQAKADITLEFDTRTRAWPRFLPIPCIDGGVRPLAKRVTSLESLVLLSEPGRANNSRRYNPWTRSVLSNSACKLFNRKDKPHETFEVVSGECPRHVYFAPYSVRRVSDPTFSHHTFRELKYRSNS